ncbi:MAG: hypothetical protein PHS32_20680 [Rhodoferax sp.]|uniref:hypothetical protein n=1 Tax=Rhodoferax sp. TaxID=50421 RepID=UPI002628475A|nr:hypothetical protein [Rhodoferax sp.]MDD5336159.1 hypothetical protein [Rhodoferax sp.]
MTATKNPKGKPTAELSPATMKTLRARMALSASINGAAVIEIFQGNIVGKDTELSLLVDGLRDTFKEVGNNDLSELEAMLMGQATALQTIFTSLARRAQEQEYQKKFEAFLGLALKAQAQSRATISALVDLKYPRQATFVKQANIANGPQQVNNGVNDENCALRAGTHAHKARSESQQNKLLGTSDGNYLDTRAQGAASRTNPHLATVG